MAGNHLWLQRKWAGVGVRGVPVGGGGGREGVRTSAVAGRWRALAATKSHFTGKQLDVVTVGCGQ